MQVKTRILFLREGRYCFARSRTTRMWLDATDAHRSLFGKLGGRIFALGSDIDRLYPWMRLGTCMKRLTTSLASQFASVGFRSRSCKLTCGSSHVKRTIELSGARTTSREAEAEAEARYVLLQWFNTGEA
jgi:hypothetical protein